MQDFTGVPCVVDLATMREAVRDLGGDPARINPLAPAELVIDHSVIADVFGRADAFERNVDFEYERNRERYQFLRWGQSAFDEFKVVPPGTGIVHQVNIEHLARVVMVRGDARTAYPDTCVGTDSHTTMVNGLGVLGWGVGGIEAEAAMLGQPVSMLIPRVVGFRLTGRLPEGATATDLVLTITEMLRRHGVVGKFVEFYGDGVAAVPLANRATIGNMSPEFGSTCAIFPIDDETVRYLRLTGRPDEQVALVEAYAREQGLWHDPTREPVYSEYVELDLGTVVPSLAGPRRPQDRVALADARVGFRAALTELLGGGPDAAGSASTVDEAGEESFPASDSPAPSGRDSAAGTPHEYASAAAGADGRPSRPVRVTMDDGTRVRGRPRRRGHRRDHLVHQHLQPVGDGRRRAAGQERGRARAVRQAVGQDDARARLEGGHELLRARRARAVPGQARLQPRRLRLHDLHRQLGPAAGGGVGGGQRERPRGGVGAVRQPQLRGPDQPGREDELPRVAAAGGGVRDRRVDGRRPRARPAGDRPGRRAGLPARHLAERRRDRSRSSTRPIAAEMFSRDYADVFAGDERWQTLPTPTGEVFDLGRRVDLRAPAAVLRGDAARARSRSPTSTGARVLAMLGDSVTTDHISPAGSIKADSPAGRYLSRARRGPQATSTPTAPGAATTR